MSTDADLLDRTCDDVIVSRTDLFRKSIYVESGALDLTEYAGKYAMYTVVITNAKLDATQEASLKAQIEAITGVYKAFPLIQRGVPTDIVPTGYDLKMGLEASVKIEPTPA